MTYDEKIDAVETILQILCDRECSFGEAVVLCMSAAATAFVNAPDGEIDYDDFTMASMRMLEMVNKEQTEGGCNAPGGDA